MIFRLSNVSFAFNFIKYWLPLTFDNNRFADRERGIDLAFFLVNLENVKIYTVM